MLGCQEYEYVPAEQFPDAETFCLCRGAGGAAHPALWYLAIYAGVSGTQIVFQLSSTLLLKILSLAAARTMHNNMLKSLLRCVLSRVSVCNGCLVTAAGTPGCIRSLSFST